MTCKVANDFLSCSALIWHIHTLFHLRKQEQQHTWTHLNWGRKQALVQVWMESTLVVERERERIWVYLYHLSLRINLKYCSPSRYSHLHFLSIKQGVTDPCSRATRTACNLSIHGPILPSTLSRDCPACSNYTIIPTCTGSEGEIEIGAKQRTSQRRGWR